MTTTTIRINKSVHNVLKEIAVKTNKSLNSVVDEMTIEYKKKLFWENVNSSFENLKKNSTKWSEEMEERKLWDNSMNASDE